MTGEPGWRRIVDLREAQREGLIHVVARRGGSWTDMFDRLEELVAPLIEAGWKRFDRDHDSSSEYGDSVSYMLERGDTEIQIELYEDGEVYFYPLELEYEEGGYGQPLFDLDTVSDASVREDYRRRGWI